MSAERDPGFPPRKQDVLPFVNPTSFVAFTIPWQVKPGREARAIVVKGTFDLVPGAPARLAAVADLPSGDVHEAEDMARSLHYPSDFAPWKPRADVTLTGHAYAPGGSSPASRVTFRFGRRGHGFDRTIAVFGERRWQGAMKLVPSEPRAFQRIPIAHERAFGGPGSAENPIGIGLHGAMLPNLEDPAHLVNSPSDAPTPVCFGAIPMLWPARWSKLGTYGGDWQRTRWPYFPEDFDWGFFQAAPRAQQLAYLEGDEPYEIVGMHPEHPVLAGSLPRLAPRGFVQQTTAAGEAFHEIVLRLDTATFDADAMKLVLVWRGVLEVRDDEASEVAELFVMEAPLEGPRESLAEARARYLAARAPLAPIVVASSAPARNDRAPDSFTPHERAIQERLARAGLSPRPGDEALPAALPPEPPRTYLPPHLDPVRREVEALLSSGASLAGRDFTGAELSDLDFSSRSLACAVLKGARLCRCRFAGADLTEAVLAGADLTDAALDGACLDRADLTAATLDGARLVEARLGQADLSRVRGARADLQGASGKGASFVEADLTGARFERAQLEGADLTRATLDGASFDDVVAPAIRLYEVRATKASWKRARLDQARADGAVLIQCALHAIAAPSSTWDQGTLDGSSFLGATLPGAIFTKTSCARAVFSRAELGEARFCRAKLEGASFLKANLMGASFEAADLTGADLRASNLHGAETWKAKLQGADLDQAIVTGTKLEEGH